MTLRSIVNNFVDSQWLSPHLVEEIKDEFLVLRGPELLEESGKLDIARVLYACDVVRKNEEYNDSVDIFDTATLLDEEQKQKRDRYLNLSGAVVAFLSKRQDGIVEGFDE